MAILASGFLALYVLNSQSLLLLNSGRGATMAEQSLQDRIEQLRDCSWTQLTDGNYLRNNILNAATNASRNMGQVSETITINSYPVALNPALVVTRSNGASSIVSSNNAIASNDMATVNLTLTYRAGPGGRQRTQSVTTIIAQNP